ncbi:hypothetical protein FS837_010261 [Tulasnella sp. UAMH 9824]|nr:hypothetical protein FS837_010261 [Tulasnella sp. UAMH 9824]
MLMFEEPEKPVRGASGDDQDPVEALDTSPGSENLTTEDVRVYIDYDIENPPPPPESNGWTRFVCISDTHGKSFPVPPGDVLLHAGDLTAWGAAKELRKTIEWLVSLPHPLKIVIAGNHDFALDRTTYAELAGSGDSMDAEERQEMDEAEEIMRGELAQGGNVVYLKNEAHEFKVKADGRKWSVYGSPWTPYFGGMAFNYSKEEAEGYMYLVTSTRLEEQRSIAGMLVLWTGMEKQRIEVATPPPSSSIPRTNLSERKRYGTAAGQKRAPRDGPLSSLTYEIDYN